MAKTKGTVVESVAGCPQLKAQNLKAYCPLCGEEFLNYSRFHFYLTAEGIIVLVCGYCGDETKKEN